MSWNLPKGHSFLSDYTKEELKNLYKTEKNPKAKVRLLAAVCRKEGKALRDIGDLVEYPFTTVRDWLVRMHKNGLDSRYNGKKSGKPSHLTKNQLQRLDKILNASPEEQGLPFVIWTTKLVQYIILKIFGVKYVLRHVWLLVKKLGYNLKVPRQENRKANKKSQEKFKEELKKKYNITLNLDSRSFVLTKHTSS